MADHTNTDFAPAERADAQVLTEQVEAVGGIEWLGRLYDAVNDSVLVLNSQRQIVYANQRCAALLGARGTADLQGLRPGEAMGCANIRKGEHGCGTTRFCRTCGAVQAILASQVGRDGVRECRIPREPTHGALDLLVRATHLSIGQEKFTVCAISDISHEKRRRALERIFFHDLLNTLSGVQMLTELATGSNPSARQEASRHLPRAVSRLAEQILEQRDLTAAENSELSVTPRPVSARPFLEDLLEMYGQSPAAEGRQLSLLDGIAEQSLRTDPKLLGRVLGNMITNALEASPAGAAVSVAFRPLDGGVEFSVHNPGAMPPEVQLQLFQRSFSTKGSGRGLGTYSIKLLTERYLKGRVSFSSAEVEGTTFRVWYPADLPG